jgi:membrane protein YqaA with SNARE-associated domain
MTGEEMGLRMRKPKDDSAEGKAGPLRRLYHWVLGWADRPGGPWALGAIATAESFIFPIPPDVLLIPLCIGKPQRAFRFAAICTVGSVLGGMLGYGIGSLLFETVGAPILELYNGAEAFEGLGRQFEDNLIIALGSAGFTPIPYKVFTIAAGAFSVSFGAFVVISAVSRAARFFLVAALIRVYGDKIAVFIEKYFNILTIVVTLAVIAGFFLIRPLMH